MNESTPGLAFGESPPSHSSYRVLARKYRPATFDELIGQDAMVRTVSNAIATGRIPQAWILTGVRGVGKTTTARILARALNYELPDGSSTGPTVVMPRLGVHCQAIMDSRHLDVIEMDAASHNGVEDVRQINEAIRYAPVSARYKVYILDEVHMLSPQAFNALLKTLEEPPPHAKFVFATTEIRKVPITILSRCQRFDLRRVDAGALVRHLAAVAAKESIEAEPEALALIARAAEGSVRDSLSLFDQAIAHAAGPVGVEHVRQMLGLADRARVIELFEQMMRGDIPSALAELRAQYETGADPAVILTDLAEFTHFVTRMKVVPAIADDPVLIEVERTRGRVLAERLSMRVLSRTWQMLLKGIEEVENAGRPLAAAEMVLVRIAYAADLPTPDEVIRALNTDQASARRQADPAAPGIASASALPPAPIEAAAHSDQQERAGAAAAVKAAPAASPAGPCVDAERKTAPVLIERFEDLIALAASHRDIGVKLALERDVRLVRCSDGCLEIRLEKGAAATLVNDLTRKLSQWTNRAWSVIVSAEQGQPTVKSQLETRKAELKTSMHADPLVQAVLARFPGAEIVEVRKADAIVSQQSDPAAAEANGPSSPQEFDVGAMSAEMVIEEHDEA
ncbi:MAG TPA: DNA polymerase III subunit gamma/tau [Xanthobacteraceae bacterium]|jgi:DNA polymerase-3 subunit gamma/tau